MPSWQDQWKVAKARASVFAIDRLLPYGRNFGEVLARLQRLAGDLRDLLKKNVLAGKEAKQQFDTFWRKDAERIYLRFQRDLKRTSRQFKEAWKKDIGTVGGNDEQQFRAIDKLQQRLALIRAAIQATAKQLAR
jgi:hypothetical protein